MRAINLEEILKYVDFPSASAASVMQRHATEIFSQCRPALTSADLAQLSKQLVGMADPRARLADLERRSYENLAFGPRMRGSEIVTKGEITQGRLIESWIRDGLTTGPLRLFRPSSRARERVHDAGRLPRHPRWKSDEFTNCTNLVLARSPICSFDARPSTQLQ